MDGSTEPPLKKSDLQVEMESSIPPLEERASSGDFQGALDTLMGLEKKCRMGGDAFATSHVAQAVVRVCWGAQNYKELNAQLLALCKRRGQLKQAIMDIVQLSMTYIPQLPAKADKEELILTLKAVTDGKIYAEVERARVTLALAMIREGEGKVSEASEILQECAVETFGSMEKKEKTELLLEQVRLTLAQRDFSRMGILANKVNKKVLDEVGFEDLRLRFYGYMSQLAHHGREALALVKHSQAVLLTRGLGEDGERWRPVFETLVLFLALAPRSNESADIFARIKGDPRLEEVGASYQALVKYFCTPELVPWPLPAPHAATIAAHPAFALNLDAIGGSTSSSSSSSSSTSTSSAMSVIAPSPPLSSGRIPPHLTSTIILAEDEPRNPSWWPILEKRVLQHNLRVVAGVYSDCTIPRLCALANAISPPTLEAQISELVANGSVHAKINRPAGVVHFGKRRPPTAVLSDWASDMDGCLNKVEMVVHLLRKEEQMAAALARAQKA